MNKENIRNLLDFSFRCKNSNFKEKIKNEIKEGGSKANQKQ